jgi:hypothetical protein
MLRTAVLALVAGCSPLGEGSPLVVERCQQIHDRIVTLMSDRGSCETSEDCAIVGGQTGDYPTCNCADYVIDCAGLGVAKNMPGLAEVQALEQEYGARGCTTWGQDCDCAPADTLECTNHRCAASASQSCLPEPMPDAGIDAP